MAGMSGTISDAKEELLNVYGEKVIVIPPNRPVQRKDLPDFYFKNAAAQMPGIEPGWHGFGDQLISNYLYIRTIVLNKFG